MLLWAWNVPVSVQHCVWHIVNPLHINCSQFLAQEIVLTEFLLPSSCFWSLWPPAVQARESQGLTTWPPSPSLNYPRAAWQTWSFHWKPTTTSCPACTPARRSMWAPRTPWWVLKEEEYITLLLYFSHEETEAQLAEEPFWWVQMSHFLSLDLTCRTPIHPSEHSIDVASSRKTSLNTQAPLFFLSS